MWERKRAFSVLASWLVCLLAFAAGQAAPQKKPAGKPQADAKAKPEAKLPAGPVSFHKHIHPIFRRYCQGCHQPAKPSGKLVLTSYEELAKGGASGPSFVPGKPDESLLVQLISGPEPKMPKNLEPLSKAEVELIRRWIAEGAKDDTPVEKDPINQDNPPVYVSPPVISALAYSPDGKTLAVSGYHEVLVHQSDGSGLIARLVGESHRVESVVYSPDGKILAVTGGMPYKFGEVQFWDTQTNKLINAVKISYDALFGASFSPDGKLLAFGCADNTARVVLVPDGNQVLKFDNHSDWVFSTTFTVDGKRWVSAGRDRAMKLIEVSNGQFIDDINKLYEGIKCIARHPKEDKVVYGGWDGIPRLYRISDNQGRTAANYDTNLLWAFEKQPGIISAVAFSPDGTKIVVGGFGGQARIYKVRMVVVAPVADSHVDYARQVVGQLIPRGLGAEVLKPGDFKDGVENEGFYVLVVGDSEVQNRTVSVRAPGRKDFVTMSVEDCWAMVSKALMSDEARLATLKGHEGPIFALAWHPDGKHVATGGFDGKVRIFNAETGELVKEFIPVPLSSNVASK